MSFFEELKRFNTLTYRLQYLIRYSNVPRIQDESVAAHSFFVATIVLFLRDWYTFDVCRAMGMAICHDLPEARLNDICHETKVRYPKLNEFLNEYEVEVANEELPNVAKNYFLQFINDDDTVESKIVKLADAVQCYQYSCNEILLGNKGYMEEVQVNSSKRMTELINELTPYEVNPT